MSSKKRVFLDSSVLFTAVNSPTGGSAKLFTLKEIALITSPLVLTEVERNVKKKLEGYHLERFFMIAKKIKVVSQLPNDKLIAKAKRVTAAKDACLDIKHFKTSKVAHFLRPQKVLTPKELIESI